MKLRKRTPRVLWNGADSFITDKYQGETMPDVTQRLKEIHENCPEGYTVITPGGTVDMLGKTEFWRIFEHHAEPHLTRIPQDLIDTGYGGFCPARVPEEWGCCFYYKIV